ncbi:hypothetical protein [Reinekea sp. G2M2-21]|uniref:hypothetical protein n=1 Tax=Reinekea sp. G2M2-21 TaxID=2788942 RepID=UPI0018A93BC3|nr:hypothetical protein [Reinekea sp. G2M2-21]MDX1341691.1 hypothetical protein [Reinekea sp.]
MTEANVRRMHTPVYKSSEYPPMPPRIRLAANCWERVWWLTLVAPLATPDRLAPLVNRFATETVSIRAQLRTCRRICFAITTQGLDDQSEFEIAMLIMAQINRELGEIERVEDRPANMWPIDLF